MHNKDKISWENNVLIDSKTNKPIRLKINQEIEEGYRLWGYYNNRSKLYYIGKLVKEDGSVDYKLFPIKNGKLI